MAIGIALIGSGIFATEQHLPAIKACPKLTLRAIYSRSLKSAKALRDHAGDVDLYSDDSGTGKTYHDLLLRSDIQGVVIALPILSQGEHIEAALLSGKHVLSEKPIAGDLKAALALLQFYNSKIDKTKVFWAVAENFRFLDSFLYAMEEIEKLGKILGFRASIFSNVKIGSKYFETAWRKEPSHQGGFVLDKGVHPVACMRLMLGRDTPVSLSAFTSLQKKHLPPVDTVDSIWQTRSGATGTFSLSCGTTLSGADLTVACENGSVTVQMGTVIVRKGDQSENNSMTRVFSDEGSGVKQEIKAWAESLEKRKPNQLQSPEEALADLEILEKMLRSGEANGRPLELEFQL